MSLVLADGVKETTTTTGNGTLSLGGAPTGLRTFVAGIGNGNTCPYRVDDGLGNWEETWGTIASGTPDTVTRGTFIASSTGSRITFAAGTKTVAVVPMVELLLMPANNAALVETSIASATTTDLGTVQTFCALITNSVTITGFGTQPNALRIARFAAALTLTHHATDLILLTGANRTTIAGDVGIYMSDASGKWRELSYSSTSPSYGGAAIGKISAYQPANSLQSVYFASTAGAGTLFGANIAFTAQAPNNGTSYFLRCNDSSADRALIYSNGGLSNFSANNVNLSDASVKTNIESLSSYVPALWDAHKNIDWKRFKYSDQEHDDWNYGYTAQNIEQAFSKVAPELVGEWGAKGSGLKGVYHDDLHNVSGAVLSAAQKRIEVLESQVAALMKRG